MNNKNLSSKAAPSPVQEPEKRCHNFEEVAGTYSPEDAVSEAHRCLGCPNSPCCGGCPVAIHIPEFIAKVAEKDFEGAYQVIAADSSLPAVCGRVCPQESQCEKYCVRGKNGESVAIGRLERFVADWHREHHSDVQIPAPSNGHKAAVIGSGPSGLACAGDLRRMGYDVTIFEALHEPGGVLTYGIPEFRLPKAIVKSEIDGLRAMGVKIETDMVMGRVLTVEDLFGQGYEAVFIGSGAGLPNFMGIPGETLCGVFSANEYLTRVNLMKAYQAESRTPLMHAKRVAVVGGGNVAMDAARCARRMGAEVTVVYRRSRTELPARREEVDHAEEEGVVFHLLANPVEIEGDEHGFVKSMLCDEMELGEPDASGRRRPVVKPNSRFTLDVDAVIIAIGTSPNPLLHRTTPGLEINRHGCLITEEESCRTTHPGVFAGGDAVTGAATVILAMGAGREAAKEMDEYVRSKGE